MSEQNAGRLAGKIALVTGAAGGIGSAVCERFAEEGATVYAADVKDPDPFDGELIRGVSLDVTSDADWQSIIDAIDEEHGQLDVLVNNAGVIYYEAFHEMSLEQWNRDISVNQTGVFLGTKHGVSLMRERGGGSIINTSSVWGNTAVSGAAAYHASKAAVRNMTKNAAITYVDDGIRANSVHPGTIRTPLTDRQDDEINEAVVGNIPMDRMGKPREIADGMVFLASDESSFMTGAELVIDGGYLAQ